MKKFTPNEVLEVADNILADLSKNRNLPDFERAYLQLAFINLVAELSIISARASDETT